MTHDTFERDLVAMLAARDPGAAPARLEGIARDRIAGDRGGWPALLVVRAGLGLAAVAVVLAAVAIPLLLGRLSPSSPGASYAPLPPPAYVLKEGDGLIAGAAMPIAQILAGGAVFLALVLYASRVQVRRNRIGAVLGALIVAYVALTIGESDALAFRDGGYGVDPGRVDSERGMVLTVDGDGPFTAVVTVTNTSRLPLTLLGLTASSPAAVPAITPDDGNAARLVGLGTLPADSFDRAAVQAFSPVTLGPREQVNVVVLGYAGACSLASQPSDGGLTTEIATLPLTYEQLTIVHEANFELPESILVTSSASCSSG